MLINRLAKKILTLVVVFIAITTQAQNQLPEKIISVKAKDATLADLLDQIEKASGIPFSYNPKRIPVDKKITYEATNKKFADVLKEVCALAGLGYSFVENQIILRPEARTEKPAVATVSGYVKDKDTGEALIGATIYLAELKTGAVSNAYGFYSLTAPIGTYHASCSFIGYKDQSVFLSLNASMKEDIVLQEEPPVLQEIVVSGEATSVVEESQVSKTDFRPKAVEERPALFGEMDVIKSLESVPGIKLHSDGSTFYYVRGGNRDQNLVLIDDAPIYNPSHMLGFFSTIIPDAVNDISIYRGEMPASLGGRLSSVLDVRTKKGNDQRTQVWGNASLISNKIGVEGPIEKGASSYLVSARFSRLAWLAGRANDDITAFQFHDITGKLNFQVGKNDKMYFSFYSGRDRYIVGNGGINWTNGAATFRWNHLISNKLFLNTTLAGSAYDYLLYYDIARNIRWNSHISNVNLKMDFSYFRNPQSELTFGLGVSGYFFNPGNLKTNDPNAVLPSLSVRNSAEVVAYVNHERELGDRWKLNYGLRLTSWSNTGESYEFVLNKNHQPIDTLRFAKGESYKTYGNAEPRISVTRQLNERSSIKAGFGRNVQNVHLISNSVSPFTSLEVWLPSSINIKPQTSNQVSVGYYRSFQRAGLSLTAEAFYKSMQNQIDFVSHAQTLLNPLLESELRFGNGKAYGVEGQVRKDAGRLRGWVGYSYARARRQFDEINGGRSFNAFCDRPHQVNLMLSYDVSLRWNIGMNWNYLTGAPFTSPIGFYSYNGAQVPIYGDKNNDRLPDYHRMDVSGTYKLNKNPERKFHHSLTFSIFNFYGRKNPLFVNYNKTQVDVTNFKVPTNLLENDRTISQFYLFQFTPSITYNFKWI